MNSSVFAFLQCNTLLDYNWDIAKNATQKLGGGHFVTEFGGVGEGETSLDALHNLMDHADTAIESW